MTDDLTKLAEAWVEAARDAAIEAFGKSPNVLKCKRLNNDAEAAHAAFTAAAAKVGEREQTAASLSEFFSWATQVAFDGCDLEGSDIQDKAHELGLLTLTAYDPDVHGPSNCDAEPGADWYVISDAVRALASQGTER